MVGGQEGLPEVPRTPQKDSGLREEKEISQAGKAGGDGGWGGGVMVRVVRLA